VNARGIYEALLASRKLPKPDGRPLYEYRFTRQEFDNLAAVLRSTRGGFLDDRWGRALFVAFTAEWYRREREGGHWDWVHPLKALGVHYHSTEPSARVRYPQVRAAAEAGTAASQSSTPSLPSRASLRQPFGRGLGSQVG
jgi:hypothetical protein